MNFVSLKKSLPYFLLLAYVIFVIFSLYAITHSLNLIINHPVQVMNFAHDIRGRLGELQHTLPGIMSSPELDYEAKVKILKQQEDLQDKSIAGITKYFLGKPEYVEELKDAFVKIRKLRREAARELTGNADYGKANQIFQEMIGPQVDVVNFALNKIIASAQSIVGAKQEEVRIYFFFNVASIIFVGFLVSVAFHMGSRRIEKKNRELEAQYNLFNQLSENIDEIFIIAKNDNEFEYVTTNSDRLIKIPARQLMAEPAKLYSFLPEDDALWLEENLSRPLAAQKQARVVIMNNGSRIFRINLVPIESGRLGKIIFSLQDRTNDYKQKQALSDALESANAASVAKSSFLAHMSHEIRTPMNAIIGMTTIALSRIGNQERVRDCLDKISDSSRHLLGLINDVLDMSKIENGKLTINHEPFSLPASIRSINEIVRPQAEDRQLSFEIFQENVDVEELLGDALRLNQVLLNILSNALKFTPQGGTITLVIRQLFRNDRTARLAFIIEDTGIGMSQEFLERLYRPFEQATSSTSSKYGGTGLGMSITFNLVTLMRGSINVESTEGKGTKFIVELPFGYQETSLARADGLPTLRILVVDDDLGTCEHAALLLERMGMVAHWCRGGKEAIEKILEAEQAGTAYDACFVDWQMPGMDGAETAKKIRNITRKHMLIIIISAYDWTPIEKRAREAGVTEFIPKPFFASTIYNALLGAMQKMGLSADANDLPAAISSDKLDLAGKRILLVEDNEFNQEIGREFLEMANGEVENAVNGQDAIDKFLASAPGYYDLILMDIQMPVMNGYEATRAIRASSHEDAKKIPILAMTANAFNEDVANAVASGMNGHIAKPIDIQDLYRLLRRHLLEAN